MSSRGETLIPLNRGAPSGVSANLIITVRKTCVQTALYEMKLATLLVGKAEVRSGLSPLWSQVVWGQVSMVGLFRVASFLCSSHQCHPFVLECRTSEASRLCRDGWLILQHDGHPQTLHLPPSRRSWYQLSWSAGIGAMILVTVGTPRRRVNVPKTRSVHHQPRFLVVKALEC